MPAAAGNDSAVANMKQRIEPGMLCLITRGPNSGRECTVLRWLKTGDYVAELRNWFGDTPGWFVAGPSLETRFQYRVAYTGYSVEDEQDLMPLRGDPKTLQEPRQEAVPA